MFAPHENGFVVYKDHPQTFTALVGAGSYDVAQVEIDLDWNSNHTVHMLCVMQAPDPGTTNHYSCQTDLKDLGGRYPPEGRVSVGAYAVDAKRNSSGPLPAMWPAGDFKVNNPPSTQTANGSLNICKDTQFASCKNYKVGEYADLSSDGYANSVSSIQLGTGCTLVMYLGKNFTGVSGTTNSSNPDLSQFSRSPGLPNGFDNAVQSMKVQSCTGDPPMPSNNPTATPTSGTSGGVISSGVWVSFPSTIVQGSPYTIVVRGYRINSVVPDVANVNLTGQWNGSWHNLCSIPNNDPSLGDYYYCTTTFNAGGYPPNGQVSLRFDVVSTNGSVNTGVAGMQTAMFTSSTTNVSSAINDLNQHTTMVLAAMDYQPSDSGHSGEEVKATLDCFKDLGRGVLGTVSKFLRVGINKFKVIELYNTTYDKGSTYTTIIYDEETHKYNEVVFEFVKQYIPYSSCLDIPNIMVPVIQSNVIVTGTEAVLLGAVIVFAL